VRLGKAMRHARPPILPVHPGTNPTNWSKNINPSRHVTYIGRRLCSYMNIPASGHAKAKSVGRNGTID
jgi:hypothetical protein